VAEGVGVTLNMVGVGVIVAVILGKGMNLPNRSLKNPEILLLERITIAIKTKPRKNKIALFAFIMR